MRASDWASDWASDRASDGRHTHCTVLKSLFLLLYLNYNRFLFDKWPYVPF